MVYGVFASVAKAFHELHRLSHAVVALVSDHAIARNCGRHVGGLVL